ncbi:MAG: hypothetical protein EA377_02425, partial [Phycisphaerales bacterium]
AVRHPIIAHPSHLGEVLPGINSRKLTLTNVTAADIAQYSVVISNTCGDVASDSAVLSLTTEPSGPACIGDINIDGAVNVSDLLQLLSNWGTCP